jgi:hypothetical protein
MTYKDSTRGGQSKPMSIRSDGVESSFSNLLHSIDEADRESWREEMRRFRDRDQANETAE